MAKFDWGFPWLRGGKLEKKKQRREREKFLKEMDDNITYLDPSEIESLSPPLGKLFYLDIYTDGNDDIS